MGQRHLVRIKPRVFQRDGRLRRKQVKDFQSLLGKGIRRKIVFQVEDGRQFALVEQRRTQDRFGLRVADIRILRKAVALGGVIQHDMFSRTGDIVDDGGRQPGTCGDENGLLRGDFRCAWIWGWPLFDHTLCFDPPLTLAFQE